MTDRLDRLVRQQDQESSQLQVDFANGTVSVCPVNCQIRCRNHAADRRVPMRVPSSAGLLLHIDLLDPCASTGSGPRKL